MAKEYTLSQMVQDMKVNSKMMNIMAKEYTLSQMVEYKMDFGQMMFFNKIND